MTTTLPAATTVPTEDTRRRNLTIVALAAVTALAIVFFMISSVTSAAWTDTTRNDGESWNTGTVSLIDDRPTSKMFTVTNMVPGQVEESSITVTNDSTVPLAVRLYGENLSDSTPSLAAHLNVKIGTTAGAHDVFNGTLASLGSTYATGTPVLTLAAANAGNTDDQTYHFSVELDANAPGEGAASVQGTTATIDFVWEGQTVAP